ncbi:MAG: preprotein translocase subunit SecA [Cellvibrionales bacterium]|nr:preprotein translocase subunit SecA [Cellvibrionales bacterium]
MALDSFNWLGRIFGTWSSHQLRRMGRTVAAINALEPQMQAHSDAQLRQVTTDLRQQLESGTALDALLPPAFAAVREASQRTLGLRHFDVQMLGGIGLHQGNIAEMRTGEGKTLVATLAAYLNALGGAGVHLVTVNDYLARRDAHWMGPIFAALGLSLGVVQSTGAGPNNASFRYDPDFAGPTPNFPHLRPCTRADAYAADITYGTNNEFGFDYLRDNMVFAPEQRTQRTLNFAIVDEVDSILIDEARTPLIISGMAEDSSALYIQMNKLIPQLKRQPDLYEDDDPDEADEGDFVVDEKMQSIELTESGHSKVEQLLIERELIAADQSLYAPQNLNLWHHVHTALKAHHLNHRNVEYIVQNGQVVLIDPHTGRTMPGRRMGEGLHQAIEAKEGVPIQSESQTLASTTFQNYFRLYKKLAGMTGTADTEAVEFQQIYRLNVLVVPTNKPTVRRDLDDLIYLTAEEKYAAVVDDISDCVSRGAPVLVGTVSVESSEQLSATLRRAGLKHQVLNAKYHEKEAQIIAGAGRPGMVTIATNMAGRGTDIVLGGNLEAELAALDIPSDAQIEKARAAWQKRHQQVLDAGGLHIIGTERHESRRIDNQLRGRAGRQGDPGRSRFYLSMEDSLMRLFASDRVRNVMGALGMQHGEAIEHRMVTGAIEKAQRKVEGRNFDIRKQLLEYDDVANDQRTLIYQQRRELIDAEDISDRLAPMRRNLAAKIVAAHMPPDSVPELWTLEALDAQLSSDFGLQLGIADWVAADKSLQASDVEVRVTTALTESYEEKVRPFPAAVIRRMERDLMLQVLDKLWKEHLAAMDQLRAGIGLRGYAGRNPRQEYKRESFEMFSQLLDRVRQDFIQLLARVQLATAEEVDQARKLRERREQQALATHSLQHQVPATLDGLGALATPTATRAAPPPAAPFVRNTKKIGRNDACPCGSGKKYKRCCGAQSPATSKH